MKATMTFELPEEREEFETTVKALDWKFAMSDLDEYLRNELKYGAYVLDAETTENIRSKIYDILTDRNLKLHD